MADAVSRIGFFTIVLNFVFQRIEMVIERVNLLAVICEPVFACWLTVAAFVRNLVSDFQFAHVPGQTSAPDFAFVYRIEPFLFAVVLPHRLSVHSFSALVPW
ncbi:Uncharacterised protein [Escherichia coli]|uniref:Uncharacterized protein n=1 Tax=Escherichia coli TaxID=562 RepID=A0A376MTQ7_ECOLX|nr:Uncharacterised protein [Escherichia coli]